MLGSFCGILGIRHVHVVFLSKYEWYVNRYDVCLERNEGISWEEYAGHEVSGTLMGSCTKSKRVCGLTN